MSNGLMIWDAAGQIRLDATSRTGRILGAVNSGTNPGSIVYSGGDAGTPFAMVLAPGIAGFTVPPIVSISTNVVSWSWPDLSNRSPISVPILYGVF